MSQNLTDKEQIEMMKKWWNDYGRSIAIAIAIGLAIGFGWRYWGTYKTERASEASGLYMQVIAASTSPAGAPAIAKTAAVLKKKYTHSPYASLAALFVAKNDVAANNFDAAVAQYRWVIKNSKMPSLQQIARIRGARVLIAQNKLDDALKMLQTVSDVAYKPLIAKVTGNIYQLQGKPALAQKAYQQAKAGMLSVGVMDPFLAMKITGVS